MVASSAAAEPGAVPAAGPAGAVDAAGAAAEPRPAPRRARVLPDMVASSASGSAGAGGAGLELRDGRRAPGAGEAGQRQLGARDAAAPDQLGGVLAERRPELEAVARAAAEQPDVAGLGMAVDQQLA